MADNAKVEALIAEHGLKKGFVAQRIGISRQALSMKLSGKTKWSADDISEMKSLLGLSPSETIDIFLSTK